MAVEQGSTGIVGYKIDFHLLVTASMMTSFMIPAVSFPATRVTSKL